MPTFVDDLDTYDPAEMAQMNCEVSKWFVIHNSHDFWSTEAFLLLGFYILAPALTVVLIAGYWDTLRGVASTYGRWLKHGTNKPAD